MCIEVNKVLWNHENQGYIKFPFIVPPTGNKPFLHSLLKPIWSEAAKALRNAELIIIIGYSFPTTDPFFRNFFALSTIDPTDLEKIMIVDPSLDSHARLTGIVSPDLHNKIEFLQSTFEESMNEIINLSKKYLEQWQ